MKALLKFISNLLEEKAVWWGVGLFAVAFLGYAWMKRNQGQTQSASNALAAYASQTAEPYSSSAWSASLTTNTSAASVQSGANQAATAPTTNGTTSTGSGSGTGNV